MTHTDLDKFRHHCKASEATLRTGTAVLNAHLRVGGIAHALRMVAVMEDAINFVGGPDSPVRAAFLAYLAAQDADYAAAKAKYKSANAYASAALKDDA